eukprot:PLAT2759.1.p2 GENE.PLAT2759.1~~PLAT2759.1.p2  ORF type:complete len:304 (+),score=88.39 PLAT2759.1:108-914(+)
MGAFEIKRSSCQWCTHVIQLAWAELQSRYESTPNDTLSSKAVHRPLRAVCRGEDVKAKWGDDPKAACARLTQEDALAMFVDAAGHTPLRDSHAWTVAKAVCPALYGEDCAAEFTEELQWCECYHIVEDIFTSISRERASPDFGKKPHVFKHVLAYCEHVKNRYAPSLHDRMQLICQELMSWYDADIVNAIYQERSLPEARAYGCKQMTHLCPAEDLPAPFIDQDAYWHAVDHGWTPYDDDEDDDGDDDGDAAEQQASQTNAAHDGEEL